MTLRSTALLGYDHVQLAMPRGGEEQARAFWTGVLGFVELERPADMAGRAGAWFGFPGGQLHVGVEDAFVAAKKAHPAFRARSAEAVTELARHLEAAGCTVRWATESPDTARFHVDDPFGNRLEFTCPR